MKNLKLKKGNYVIRVMKEGYNDYLKEVYVLENDLDLSFTLTRKNIE